MDLIFTACSPSRSAVTSKDAFCFSGSELSPVQSAPETREEVAAAGVATTPNDEPCETVARWKERPRLRDLRGQLVELGFRTQPVLKLVPGQKAPMLRAQVCGLGNLMVTFFRIYGCRGWRFTGVPRHRGDLEFAERFLSDVSACCVYVGHRCLLNVPNVVSNKWQLGWA
jgi:hypothetical protein